MELNQENILRAAAEAAQHMDRNPQPGIMPQPVPTAVQLSSIKGGDGRSFVMITLSTPVGQNVFFFDPESAEKIADGLKETTRLARTGLEIAR